MAMTQAHTQTNSRKHWCPVLTRTSWNGISFTSRGGIRTRGLWFTLLLLLLAFSHLTQGASTQTEKVPTNASGPKSDRQQQQPLATGQQPERMHKSIVKSAYAVKLWADDQLQLAHNLAAYIRHEEKRLRIMANFSGYEEEVPLVKKRISVYNNIQEQLLQNATDLKFLNKLKGNHPTTLFASFRNFLSTWEEKLANQTLYGKRLSEFLERNGTKPLPSRNELEKLSKAIAILQSIYDLSVSQLVKGEVIGHKGEPLTKSDCYEIGKAAMKMGFLDTAKEWLDMALSDTDLATLQPGNSSFNVSDALACLAKMAFQKKDKNKALELFEKATEIDGDNMGLYQDYMKHRFGREISPLFQLDRDGAEPWNQQFFHMCGNSTNVTRLQEDRATLKPLWCRLRKSRTVPYMWYKEEILSKSPYISSILDFVGGGAIENLLAETRHNLNQIFYIGRQDFSLQAARQHRTNLFNDFKKPTVGRISFWIGDLTGYDVRQGPNPADVGQLVDITEFGLAGLAVPHHYAIRNFQTKPKVSGRRVATVQVYLSDVTAGGATVFPKQNITILPRKGLALLWYNHGPSGDQEENLLSAICPLAVGENLVLEKTIWQTELDKMAFCGKRPSATYLSADLSQKKMSRTANSTSTPPPRLK